jgi:hypothetical protein
MLPRLLFTVALLGGVVVYALLVMPVGICVLLGPCD